jgi:Dehydratase family
MREAMVFAPVMLTPTRAIIGAGLRDKVALLTNGQSCGGSHDFCIGTLLMGKISPRRHQRLQPLQNWRPAPKTPAVADLEAKIQDLASVTTPAKWKSISYVFHV